jgi:TolB-like protein/Flp pilus assembly protein TadD
MFTDIVGYSSITSLDEGRALKLLDEHRTLLRSVFEKHAGRVVKTLGDGFLVEFASAVEAVNCAVQAQRETERFDQVRRPDEKLLVRIGIHVGDIVHANGDILGDAVNVASRLQALADPGGICLTKQVVDQVEGKVNSKLVKMGTRELKNIPHPVELYKVEVPQGLSRAEQESLDPRRIAILPFANMSPDPNDSYFADGITEEIISTLSGVGGLSVISRTSVMGYKGTTKRVREIGNELEAGSVLEGSFRKAGNKIRVTAQLIAVNDDRHVWAQSYDRNLDDVFGVQTDLAKHVSDALRVRILAPEMDRIEKKPTENTKAYSLYLRGRYHWNRRGLEDLKRAADYFEEAIDEDENFALGYAGIADASEILAFNWAEDATANHKRASLMVAKALELDPRLAEAHATKGLILTCDLDVQGADKEYRKACELKPSYASAHQWYSSLLAAQGKWDEARRHIEKAVELDPFSQIINLNHASYYLNRRDYDKALELCKKALELDPSFSTAHFELAAIYCKSNRLGEGEREAKIALDLVQGLRPRLSREVEVMTAYYGKDMERVRSLLPDLEAHVDEPLSPTRMEISGLYIFLGDLDQGFEWLEKSFSKREKDLLYISHSDMFDGVREDPRYLSLVKRLGLA